MKRYLLILVITGLLVTEACKHSSNMPVPDNDTTAQNNNGNGGNGNNGGGNGNGGGNTDTGICFERDILPIFISNCAKAGCHDAVTKQDGYRFTDYNSIISKEFVAGNAEKTELYEKITEDRTDKIMPPPPNAPLTSAQKDLIKRWINAGAENSTDCGGDCDTNNFAFAADIQPIFDRNCKGCHNSQSAPLGIMLDSYTGIKAAVNGGQLLGAIRHEPGFANMPQGGNKLLDCNIRQIEKWIDAGTPNN